MQSHTLKRTHANKKGKTVGRGGTRGKTAGRGTKGQNARAGHKKRPEMRDFIKRLPKLRGRGKNGNTSIQQKPYVVNLGRINTLFKAGETVTPKALVALKAFNSDNGIASVVKILGTGVLDKKLTFTGCLVSASAKTAIEKAGGTVTA
jgi:large subunit ribosomal protein L15